MFIDDILLFSDGPRQDLVSIKLALSLFEKATGMMTNIQKSTLTEVGCPERSLQIPKIFFHSIHIAFMKGLNIWVFI